MLAGIVAVEFQNPRNSKRAGLHADKQVVANAKAIKVKSSDGQSLDLMPFTPRSNHETAALKKQSGHVEPADDPSGHALWRRGVKFPVAEQQNSHDPGQRHQAEKQPLENFHVATLAGALIDYNRHRQADEEYDTNENQHFVKIERRKHLAGRNKDERAD